MKNFLKKKNKKKKNKLPDKILVIPNPDKIFHEKWISGRNMLNVPHPYRTIIFSEPNMGKTNLIKNIILRANPPFKNIIVCHYDGDISNEDDHTLEYDDLGDIIMIDNIPDPRNQKIFDKKEKSLIIFDDMEFEYISKNEKKYLDRLFGYSSTHKNQSIILCAQNYISIPKAVRRMCNFMIMFKLADDDLLDKISKKIHIEKSKFKELIKNTLIDVHDSLWFDMTLNTPYKLRRNGYEIIDINKYL
jgi:hypothetical protein